MVDDQSPRPRCAPCLGLGLVLGWSSLAIVRTAHLRRQRSVVIDLDSSLFYGYAFALSAIVTVVALVILWTAPRTRIRLRFVGWAALAFGAATAVMLIATTLWPMGTCFLTCGLP